MVNKVTLLGRIGGTNPTTTQAGGSTVTKFSIATSENYKDKEGNKVEKTEWHNITVWGKLGETIATYFKKGDPIYLEGKLSTSTYEKEGQKHFSTVIVAEEFKFVPGPSKKGDSDSNDNDGGNAKTPSSPAPTAPTNSAKAPAKTSAPAKAPVPAGVDDDLPF